MTWLTIRQIYFAIIDHWGILLAVAVVLVLITGGLVFAFCGSSKPVPKLDEQGIQKAKVAIETHNTEQMRETLAESDVRVEQINGNIANSEVMVKIAVETAKDKYRGLSNDELAAELEKRK